MQKPQNHNNNLAAQRQAVLRALELGSCSTIYFREVLGICSPAPRVQELRKQGHCITTSYRYEVDTAGVKHRIGVYTLSKPTETATTNETQGAINGTG